MVKNLFIIGVGPGSPRYLTDAAKDAIHKCCYIVGYKYTLTTIESEIDRNKQKVYEVNMENQDDIYLQVYSKMKDTEYCGVPFTGDPNFSESEIVDRLLEIFGDENVEIISGISSIQIAAAKSKVPLDESHIVTFHVTGNIEIKKLELIKAVKEGKNIILIPRPWPKDQSRNFMESDIAVFLKNNEIDTSNLNVWVFEYLTKDDKENIFKGKISQLEGIKFSDMSVMVIDQVKRRTYLQFDP